MAGRQRCELFDPPVEENAVADQDRTDALLRKTCEGRFEIAIGSSIHKDKLQAQRACRPQRARRRLEVYSRNGRVRKNAEQGRIAVSTRGAVAIVSAPARSPN